MRQDIQDFHRYQRGVSRQFSVIGITLIDVLGPWDRFELPCTILSYENHELFVLLTGWNRHVSYAFVKIFPQKSRENLLSNGNHRSRNR